MTEQESFEWKCYRAIDLIKRIKIEETHERYVDRHKAFDTAIKALEEIQQYRALGTLEELREAREKQVPKKLEIGNDNGNPRKCCARCGCFVHPASRYCSKCGQAIDWEQ